MKNETNLLSYKQKFVKPLNIKTMKEISKKAAEILATAKKQVIDTLNQLPTDEREAIVADTEQRLDEIISLIDGIADYCGQ